MFPASKLFRAWLLVALPVWGLLFYHFNDLGFLVEHWFYPATMVLGAFVAGLTPEGGGAVAFPVLNIFLKIDRELARDFSLMIQSIGMSSASIYILTRKDIDLRTFRPLLWFVPTAFAGFVCGMHLLQGIEVYIIQALFLSLIASFAVAYYFSSHRGDEHYYRRNTHTDLLITLAVLFVGGMCASLFGTGADIILYTLMVTRFCMHERTATQMSVILMASLSILGFAYRGLVDQELTLYQVQTWLCAFPVVLIMAPLGAYVLARIHKEHMLLAIVLLNIGQLAYFIMVEPTPEKLLWAALFTFLLTALFFFSLTRISRQRRLPMVEAK